MMLKAIAASSLMRETLPACRLVRVVPTYTVPSASRITRPMAMAIISSSSVRPCWRRRGIGSA